MLDEVIFRAMDGALKDEEFVFEENGLCLIGRSGDCALQIPREKDMRISRRHCLLILNPPKIRIRDLGSRNGTFVNGDALPAGVLGDVPEQMSPQDRVLTHGDRVNIGETAFEIFIPSLHAAPLPHGSKIIKLTKPEPQHDTSSKAVKKSVSVDTGFFIPPPITKGGRQNTSSTTLTEAFKKPPPHMHSVTPDAPKPMRLVGKKSDGSASGATLLLKPKTQEDGVAPQRKVLKGRIVKRGGTAPPAPAPVAAAPPPAVAPPAPAPPPPLPEMHPGTAVMDNTNLPDGTKLSTGVRKAAKSNKRVTKFKIKSPKK